jgi:Spy/CpxP family protein refolding chaperone
MHQSKIIPAAIALTLGGSLILAKPPASANLPGMTSQTQFLAQATGQPPNRQVRQRGFAGGKLMEQLNLSEAQKQQMTDIRQKYQGQTRQLQQELRSERQKLKDMMAGTANESAIRSQHQRVTQLDQEMHNLRFESMLQMREVLTPEQRRQFAQLMQQRREQYRQRPRDRSQQGEL